MHTALTLVKFENVVFTDDEGYMGESEAKEKGLKPKKLSGTEFRRLMRVSSRTSSPRSAQPHADKLCWMWLHYHSCLATLDRMCCALPLIGG
jgi:ATP sulfurylase